MEDMIANLFFANSNSRPVGAMGRIESLAKSIIDINGFFALSKMLSLLEIVNVYSEEKTPILQVSPVPASYLYSSRQLYYG
jgi:hypothetical protein